MKFGLSSEINYLKKYKISTQKYSFLIKIDLKLLIEILLFILQIYLKKIKIGK